MNPPSLLNALPGEFSVSSPKIPVAADCFETNCAAMTEWSAADEIQQEIENCLVAPLLCGHLRPAPSGNHWNCRGSSISRLSFADRFDFK